MPARRRAPSGCGPQARWLCCSLLTYRPGYCSSLAPRQRAWGPAAKCEFISARALSTPPQNTDPCSSVFIRGFRSALRERMSDLVTAIPVTPRIGPIREIPASLSIVNSLCSFRFSGSSGGMGCFRRRFSSALWSQGAWKTEIGSPLGPSFRTIALLRNSTDRRARAMRHLSFVRLTPLATIIGNHRLEN